MALIFSCSAVFKEKLEKMKKKNRFDLFACFCLLACFPAFSDGRAEAVGFTKWLNPEALRDGQSQQASLENKSDKEKETEKQKTESVSSEEKSFDGKSLEVEKTEVASLTREEKDAAADSSIADVSSMKGTDVVVQSDSGVQNSQNSDNQSVPSAVNEAKKEKSSVASEKMASSDPDSKEMLTITSEGGFLLPTYVLPEVQEDILSVKSGLLQQDSPFRTPSSPERKNEGKEVSETVVSETEGKAVPSWTDKDASFVPLKEAVKEQSDIQPPVLLDTPVDNVSSEKTEEVSSEAKASKVVVENATEEDKAEGKTNEDLMVQRLEKEYEEASEVLSETDLALIRYASAIAETAREIEKLEAQAADVVDLDNPEEVEGIALASAEELQEALPEQEEVPVVDKPLLLPLAARVEKVSQEEAEILEEEPEKTTVSSAEKILQKGKNAYKLLPNEIKISFRPDNAEISGQTLKWIRAFASQIVQDPQKYVEMRVSAYGLAGIQSRRVLLLKGTLLGSGLNPSQIRIVSTPRDSDSIVLRIMEKEDDVIEITEYSGLGTTKKKTIKSW